MGFLGGIVGKLVALAVLLVVLLVAVGAFMYATDQEVEATVTDKDCADRPPTVDVKTKLGGIKRTVEVDAQECGIISAGNFVEYRLRSGRTTIYDREGGQCIYDTVTGPGCGASLLG